MRIDTLYDYPHGVFYFDEAEQKIKQLDYVI